MNRRGNIQHGQKRRMPGSVRTPIIMLCLLIPVLVWQLVIFTGGM